jgi:rhodanese-related sulfurtransferase
MDAWRDAGLPTESTPLVDARGVRAAVLDIRQLHEWNAGHVPGAVHIELGVLAQASVPDGPVTVMCGHGERAMTGASILQARGHRPVSVLAGGPADWSAATGTPLVTR